MIVLSTIRLRRDCQSLSCIHSDIEHCIDDIYTLLYDTVGV